MSLAPTLLLSMPQLIDPNFARTVILLCEHAPDGAFGLIVNRPSEIPAAEAVKLDTNHRLPKAQHLLGVLQAMRNNLSGAAENMRSYLKYAPQANDADNVKKQLAEIERQMGQVGQLEPARQP